MKLINKKIEELQFPVQMDTPAPGQRNCFFHAVWQQLQKPEIGLCGIYQDHKNL